MTTLSEIKNTLSADSYSKKNNVFTVRREFFYTHGRTAEQFRDEVLKCYPTATIVDFGEVWKPFRGGASAANSSHWFVKFTL